MYYNWFENEIFLESKICSNQIEKFWANTVSI